MARFMKIIIFLPFLLLFLAACQNETPSEFTEEKADLIVYSGHSESLTNFYVKAFQERTGLKVKTIRGGGNEVANIIKENKKSSPIDVIIGVGSDSLYANKGLLMAYDSPYLSKIRDGYSNGNKKWIGDFQIPMVIIYNKQTIGQDDIPYSWEDLLNPKFRGQIAMGDPTVSGSTYTQLVTLLTVFGKDDAAWNFIQSLTENMNGRVLNKSQDVPLKVSNGEYMLGITLESYAYEYTQQSENIGFIYPTEGTTARASGVAILKDTSHLENAKLFIDFVLSPETEEAVAIDFYRRPTHVDVAVPASMQSYDKITIIDYDYEWASQNATQNLTKWEEILSRARKTNGDNE